MGLLKIYSMTDIEKFKDFLNSLGVETKKVESKHETHLYIITKEDMGETIAISFTPEGKLTGFESLK